MRSSAPGLSSLSRVSAGAIKSVLAKHYSGVRVQNINTLADLQQLVVQRPDLVFLGMKFVPLNPILGQADPDKIWLAKYFDDNNIAYTGSGYKAHQLELNKSLAKQRVQIMGLQTSKFQVIGQNKPFTKASIDINYPVFIKPVDRGGGLGINDSSVAHTYPQLKAKVLSIANQHQADSLVEQYLPGREFSVALLKDPLTNQFLAMPIELIAPKNKNGVRMLSSVVKLADLERVREVTDVDLRLKITTLAQNVFSALGASDYGRIDIRLDSTGTPQFLEANLIPSLIDNYGSFPKACALNQSIGYEKMILHIVNLAMLRKATHKPTPKIDIAQLAADLIKA